MQYMIAATSRVGKLSLKRQKFGGNSKGKVNGESIGSVWESEF